MPSYSSGSSFDVDADPNRDFAFHFTKLKFLLGREHFFNIYLQKYGSILVHKIIIIIRNDEKSHPVCLWIHERKVRIRVRKIKRTSTASITLILTLLVFRDLVSSPFLGTGAYYLHSDKYRNGSVQYNVKK